MMAIEKELLDQLLAGRDPRELFGKDGLVDELKKALSERILNTELDEHLGSDAEKGFGNHRNGVSHKSMLIVLSTVTHHCSQLRINLPNQIIVPRMLHRSGSGHKARVGSSKPTKNIVGFSSEPTSVHLENNNSEQINCIIRHA